ncbi:MAG TPA: response regulator [Thermoplasmata archaeon]
MRGSEPQGRRPSVLVVDDDEGIRENLAELLSMDDYRTFTAASAEEALERIEADEVDLLLTDFQMPGASGVELIEAARRTRPALPAILITAFPYVYEQIDPTRRRGVTLLLKPFAAEEVLRIVARVLRP